MNNNEQLKRILIATLISFVFFIAYDYFVLQPQIKVSENNLTKEKVVVNNNFIKSTNKAPKEITQKTKIIATIEAKNYEIKLDSLGRISSFILKQAKFNTENGKKLELISNKLPKPLEIRFENKEINKLAFSTDYIANIDKLIIDNKPETIILTQKLKNEIVTKKITFYPDGHYNVKITLSNPLIYYISQGYRPDVAIDQLTIHGLIIKKADGILEIIEDGDAKNESFENIIFSASFDRYYTTLLFSKEPFNVVVSVDKDENPISFIKLDSNSEFVGYIGPKYVDTLKSVDKELVDVVQYGVGTFFARNLFFLLDWFYKLVNGWGVAIILLVILVRIILFPLTYKGMVSMYKLQKLAPKLKEIQERYKKDPQKLQMHMMKLYKENNVNPLGGCLPLLLQIPIFYGIYKLLLYSIELKGASFIWIKDLSVMDPYFILPILMGATMYVHQKITPTNFQDPMQEKVFKFLPLIFTIMMATFPAGLVLYWTVNNILSIIQQYLINKILSSKVKK